MSRAEYTRKARFITFEGGEGAGKSTQIRLLSEALAARGVQHVVSREPGGTPGAEALRALLLDPQYDWNARAEALLFAAARADHVSHLIRPALESGTWILCDRYLDSSRAYQGGAGALGDAQVMALHAIGSEGLLPDRTLLLELGADEAARRADARDAGMGDRIGGRDAAYHADVASRFRELAAQEPERFAMVDAGGPPDAVHDRVMAALADLLP